MDERRESRRMKIFSNFYLKNVKDKTKAKGKANKYNVRKNWLLTWLECKSDAKVGVDSMSPLSIRHPS